MSWGKIDLREFKRFEKQLNDLSKADMDALCREAAKGLAARLLRKAKMRTPVDTGELRRNWNVDFDITQVGNEYEITVYNATEYASYVEYGHRTRNHKGWVVGRFMMTKSEVELEKQAPVILERMLMKKLGEIFNGE